MNKQQLEQKEKSDYIRNLRGKATELISLYIPPNKQVHEVISYLRNEYTQTQNIKSKTTLKNVTSAIESAINRVKNYKQFPENGLIIFVGNVLIDKKEKFEHILIEPTFKVKTFKYHCDSNFFMDYLDNYINSDEQKIGLVVVDRREATIAVFKNNSYEIIKTFESQVGGKHRVGGQSAVRFQRLYWISVNDFYKKVGDAVNTEFLDKVDKILVGGPMDTKDKFVEGPFINHELKKKIIDVFNVCYTDESGIKELLDKSKKCIEDLKISGEKQLMDRFMTGIAKNGPVTYGRLQVLDELKSGSVETLLISTKVKDKIEFETLASNFGTTVEYISDNFYEGQTLLTTFGGFGAILRYKRF